MSQRSEKYMRRVEGQVVKTACAVGSLRGEVHDIEELVWKLLKEQRHTRKQNEQLLAAAKAHRREQRRKAVSCERITIVLCATALWCLLAWVLMEIVRMVGV